MYEKLKKAQELLWKNEDCPDQEDYFEIQEIIAEVTLEVAKKNERQRICLPLSLTFTKEHKT